MREMNTTSDTCFICGRQIDASEKSKSTTLENNRTYIVHEGCLAARKQLLTAKAELPPPSDMSSKDLIYELYPDGWFANPRSLKEVEERRQQRGFNYDSSTISHSLNDLTQRGILTRQGKRGSYAYVQKKPP